MRPGRWLRLSMAAGVGYGLLNVLAAVWNRSLWFAVVAGYYLMLSAIRLLLIRREGAPAALRWKTVRQSGWLLLALTGVIGGMSVYALALGRAATYPGHLIYGAAAYTFYALTMAIVQLVRQRRQPLWWAAKSISLTCGLVSLFFLENALLAAFGSGESWQRPMQQATAAGVFLFSAAMAVHMICKKDRE